MATDDALVSAAVFTEGESAAEDAPVIAASAEPTLASDAAWFALEPAMAAAAAAAECALTLGRRRASVPSGKT